MKTGNIFESIVEKSDDEIVELLVQDSKVNIERIISKGHTSPANGWYDQEKDEWVLVLKGEAIISYKNNKDIGLKTGDYLLIPAHTKHRVKWTDPESETIWLAIYY